MRITWVTPKWPLPAEDGARHATCVLVRALSELGVSIDLVALSDLSEKIIPEQALAELKVSSATVIPRPSTQAGSSARLVTFLRSLALSPRTAITLAAYADHEVARKLAEQIRGTPTVDAIIYDGLHCAAHALHAGAYKLNSSRPPVVYRAHNRESLIWQRRAERTKNVIFRSFLNWQRHCIQRFEDSLATQALMTATVSDVDTELFRGISSQVSAITVPIGFNFPAPAPFPPAQPRRFLFLGKLDWPPNREGLEWLLKMVWPEVSAHTPDARLVIVGSGDSRWLEPYKSLPGVDFRGRVPDVSPLYREAHACLVPVFYGSGTRVKAIEAAQFGRPCISTAIGVEGLGLQESQSYLRAESAQEWISAMVEVNPSCSFEAVGRQAYETLKARFGAQAAAQIFLDNLHSRAHRP